MDDLQHDALWASHVFHRRNPSHREIADALLGYALALSRGDAEGIASGVAPSAKRGLYESRFDLFDHPVEAVAEVRRFCVETLVEVVERIDAERLRAAPRTTLTIVESWVHVTERGGFHDHHVHAFRDWCGIYYVTTGGEGSGVNRFYQPFLSMDGNRGHYDVAPEPGWLVVFPGHLAHAALPHGGESQRIVIAFNARLSGMRGNSGDVPPRTADHTWGPVD